MPRSARTVVQLVKCGVVSTLAFVAVATASTSTENVDAGLAGEQAAPHGQAKLDRLMTKHQCSPSGFGADVIPGSALVMRANHVQHVSFDDGWAIFTGDAPGQLLAVCRVNV